MRSLRATLTLWYTLALGATALALGVTVTVLSRRSAMRALDERLAAITDRAVAVLQQEYREEGRPLVEEFRDPLVVQLRPPVQDRLFTIPAYIVVVDSLARRVYISREAQGLLPEALDTLRGRVFVAHTRDAFTLTLGGERYRFAVRTGVGAGPGVLAVAAGEPTLEIELGPQRLLASILLISPILLLFAAGIGYLLSDRALRPVAVMIDELEAISDGRSLHRRLPVPGAELDEMGRLANAINSLLARLETSFSALRRFVADASHELKTPLTVMRAGVERALTDPSTSAEALVPLEETLQGVRQMTELVDTLLTLARVDEGRMELHRETLDLSQVLRDVYETTQLLGEEAGVDVRLELPGEPVRVDADAGRIRQLVMNLATNAVKYTNPGGTVWLTLTGTPTAATIAVRDTGVGIAPGDVGRVFDRFWRADPARSRTGERPGIGLGLSISKWIAEVHGGSIGVTSRPGRGSTFTVTLPRLPAAVMES